MKQKPSLKFIIPIIIVCVVTVFAGCKGKFKEKTTGNAKTPAAEIKQSIPTPTLVPPAPSVPQATETKSQSEEVVSAPPPKGPQTVVPPPAGGETPNPTVIVQPAAQPPVPTPEPAANTAQPPIVAAPPLVASAAIPPLVLTPQVTAPATAETSAPQPIAGTEMKAIAAPTIEPPETPKPKEAEAVQYEPKLVNAKTNIEIIVDASGSMTATFGSTNMSKIDMLRSALYEALSELTAGQAEHPFNLAIRVFGAKSPLDENNREDTQLLIGMGLIDQKTIQAIHDVLNKLTPKGSSPVAFTLSEAAKDCPADGNAECIIVLIADGADSTGGDPCAAVAKIEESLNKKIFHVIAFDLNPSDQPGIECISAKGSGKFFLARNEEELRTALDQAINSSVPYNLKLSVRAGSTPIPFELTVLKAGTETVVKTETSSGSKHLNLEPGTYDILVKYIDSPEKQKPSKIIKGVEILSTTKVEQEINFDLGQLTLTAIGNDGSPVAARFDISKAGIIEPIAQIETGNEPKTVFFTPGAYDITANLLENQTEDYSLTEKDLEIKVGATLEQTFKFQKGILNLKGVTTQKESIPFTFQIFKAGSATALVATGALPSEGGGVSLTPGIYDIVVTGADPKMAANPRTKISDVSIKSGETQELSATFEMGTMKLSAVDGKNNKLPAQFVIRDHDSQTEMAKLSSDNGEAIQLSIPPGTYDIVASSLKSILEPKPSVPVTAVVVTADKPVEQVIKFVLGTIRLRGRNAKEQSILSQFTIYKADSDEKVSTAPPSADWMVFDLAPGNYDALATNVASEEKPQPLIWVRDIKVEDGKTISHEAVFTAGKLKIIGRGTNGQIIICHFKVFQYGKDGALINGETGNDWEVFEIQPGRYYLEAAYHDDEQSVMLKKWINISVGENEVVEEVLQF